MIALASVARWSPLASDVGCRADFSAVQPGGQRRTKGRLQAGGYRPRLAPAPFLSLNFSYRQDLFRCPCQEELVQGSQVQSKQSLLSNRDALPFCQSKD